jgi:plastocyanin
MTTNNAKPSRKKLWIIIGIVAVVIAVVSTVLILMDQSVSPPAAPSGPNVIVWNGTFCNGPGNCGYSPSVKTVAVGTTVTWTNNGGSMHTVTTCDSNHSVSQCPVMNAAGLDGFDSNSIASGGTFSHTFTASGTYYYYCRPHPWMQGEIIVQ